MISEDAFEKAVQSATQGKPEAPESQPEATAPTPVAETAPKAEAPAAPVAEQPATPPADAEWDGDVNKLPPELQGWAKKAQRTLTKKAMTESDDRRLGQEFKQFQSSADWQQFQQWKQQAAGAPMQQAPAQTNSAGITEQEWIDAQLDQTGAKFNALVDRRVQSQINEAAKVYGAQIQQLQTTQQVTAFQNTLSDYVDVNPDVTELYEAGVLKPFLDEEISSNRHSSYQAAIHAAAERARSIRDALEAKALQRAQGRVQEKRNAVVSTGTSVGEANVAYVDKGSTFDEAFNFAIQGKKVKVKAKQ